jgi:hypothetical protein
MESFTHVELKGRYMSEHNYQMPSIGELKLLTALSVLVIASCVAVAPPTPFETTNIEVIPIGCEEARKEDPEFDC